MHVCGGHSTSGLTRRKKGRKILRSASTTSDIPVFVQEAVEVSAVDGDLGQIRRIAPLQPAGNEQWAMQLERAQFGEEYRCSQRT